MRRMGLVLVLGVMAVALATPLMAGQWVPSCVKEAQREFKECDLVCREAFQLEKDTCVDRDHLCMENCRSARETCLIPILTILDAAIDTCNSDMAGAVAVCRQLYPGGSSQLDQCIDQAQVVGFQCRDRAREIAAPGIRQCRRNFAVCASTNCPPNKPRDPSTVKTCLQNAKQLFVDCEAVCSEDYQLSKDTCLNRDHACVEQCRTTRQECLDPILTILAADIGICNTARDIAIDNCILSYPPGSESRHQCIDDAQVAAFQCRDLARETAAPGIRTCADAFRTCAKACPPPTP